MQSSEQRIKDQVEALKIQRDSLESLLDHPAYHSLLKIREQLLEEASKRLAVKTEPSELYRAQGALWALREQHNKAVELTRMSDEELQTIAEGMVEEEENG